MTETNFCPLLIASVSRNVCERITKSIPVVMAPCKTCPDPVSCEVATAWEFVYKKRSSGFAKDGPYAWLNVRLAREGHREYMEKRRLFKSVLRDLVTEGVLNEDEAKIF